MTIDEAYERINAEIENPGTYSHNIVSSILRTVDAEHDRATANQIVEDLDLDDIFGIPQMVV